MISLKCRIFKKGSREGGQVCKCPYKMSQFWASGVRQGNHGSQYCVVHGRDAKRVDLKGSHYTKKKKVSCVKWWMCLPTLLWSFHNMYIHQIIRLYTLNLHNVICQLHLHKAGEKEACRLIPLISLLSGSCQLSELTIESKPLFSFGFSFLHPHHPAQYLAFGTE